MVCLPLRRMMSSMHNARRWTSLSPGMGGSISTNRGTMTSGQPSRMRERVPSKSKSTCVISGRMAKEGVNSTKPVNRGDMGDSNSFEIPFHFPIGDRVAEGLHLEPGGVKIEIDDIGAEGASSQFASVKQFCGIAQRM